MHISSEHDGTSRALQQGISKGRETRERIIRRAARLFIRNGYHATGINDILEASQVSKGSFYFWFASKYELAEEVCAYFRKRIMGEFRDAAADRTWRDFVDALMGSILKNTADEKNFGCPFAVLGMEIAWQEPELSRQYALALEEGVDLFRDVLSRSGFSGSEAESLSRRAMAVYEGYMLFYRLNRDIVHLHTLHSELKALPPQAVGRPVQT